MPPRQMVASAGVDVPAVFLAARGDLIEALCVGDDLGRAQRGVDVVR